MTASEKNTIFYLGILGVLAYVAVKLWPSIRRALNMSSTGGSASGTGASNSSPYYPDYENESASQGNLLSQLLNALSGNPSSAKASGQIGTGGAMPSSLGPGSSGSSFNSLVAEADASSWNPATQNTMEQQLEQDDAVIDQSTAGDTIASVPYQLYDVNQNATPIVADSTPIDTTSVDIGESIDGGDDSGS